MSPDSTSADSSSHAFNPDQPVVALDDDRLDVVPFVRRLVRPLVYAPAASSLVVGL